MLRNRVQLSCLLFTLALLGVGCREQRASAQAKRYEMRGRIVSFNKAQEQVVISHEAITGLMEAMTMAYTLREPSAYDVMKAGDEIQATLVVDGDRSWIEHPVITHAEVDASAPSSSTPTHEPQPGAQVPDFALTNQDGKRITLSQYRGRALALTFIYTRCPLPDFCTLMSNNFAEINRALEKNSDLARRAHLLSISLDPAYDTPKVLRSYGAAHTGNYTDEKFEHWEFASGDAGEVRKLANFFGLTYMPDGDQIAHSLRTAVITPDGKLYKLYNGNEWKPAEVLQDIRQATATQE